MMHGGSRPIAATVTTLPSGLVHVNSLMPRVAVTGRGRLDYRHIPRGPGGRPATGADPGARRPTVEPVRSQSDGVHPPSHETFV